MFGFSILRRSLRKLRVDAGAVGLGVSFDEFQKFMLGQLGLFNYVHYRGLVDLVVKRYDGASAVDMS
jgi:hypothetical protein